MTNKGKHNSKRSFGSRFDSHVHRPDDRKIHQISIEREDIEIPDDIDLPEEHDIPNLSNSSSTATNPSNSANEPVGSSEDDGLPKKGRGKHSKSATDPSKDKPKDGSEHDGDEADADGVSVDTKEKHPKHSRSDASMQTKDDDQYAKGSSDGSATEVPDDISTVEGGEDILSSNDDAHASDDDTPFDEEEPYFSEKAFDIKGESFFEKHPKAKKRLIIALCSTLGVLAAVYFIGVALFTFLMYPNSHIDKIDTSIKTPVPIQQELESAIDDYSFSIKGQGMNAKFSSKDVGLDVDYEKVVQEALDGQNPWIWPYEVFLEHDNSHYLKDAITFSALSDVLTAEVDSINASAVHPTNAFIRFVPETVAFEIVPEVPGSILDAQKVVDIALQSVSDLQTSIVLGDESLLEPTILKDDARLVKALGDATAILGINPTLNLNGANVYTLDAATIGPWVVVGEDFGITMNADAMNAWSDDISNRFNTVGKERIYTRPDGKVVSVSGGTYGWKVDTGNLLEKVNEAFAAKESAVIEIPVSQSGTGFDTSSGRDWGARYVDVDIAEQYARLYDANGALIWESPIVSGAKGKRDTPTGVYTLNQKAMNITLRGPMKDGEYEWESKVKYWMPFKGNSVGLHDAPWQSAFGGARYAQGFGSHGCVNLPSGKASELYGLLNPGDVVVVHY